MKTTHSINISQDGSIHFDTAVETFFNDHIVYDKPVLPGAGHIDIMMTFTKSTVLSNISFLQLLELPTTISISRINDNVQVLSGGSLYSESFIHYMNPDPPADVTLTDLAVKCPVEINVLELYPRFESSGIRYLSNYQTIKQLWCGDGEAYARIEAQQHGLNFTVDPSILDGCFQTTSAISNRGDTEPMIRTFVPYKIKQVYQIRPMEQQVFCHAKFVRQEDDEKVFEITVYNVRGKPLLHVKDFICKELVPDSPLYEIVWNQYNILQHGHSRVCCVPSSCVNVKSVDFNHNPDWQTCYQKDFDLLCRRAITTTLQHIDESRIVYDYHKHVLQRWKMCLCNDNAPTFDEMVRQYGTTPELNLYHHVVDRLPDIIHGKVKAVEVIFNENDELASAIYRDTPVSNFCNDVISKIVHQIASSAKGVRILEIGAGTGGTTDYVLPLIKDLDVEYVFTDISDYFLNNAKKKYRNYDFMRYECFDVEKAPEIAVGQYDIIIATNVIHATRDYDKTIKHVCDLLCENGVFLLNEMTVGSAFMDITFGLTEGWWYFYGNDKYRKDYPLLTLEKWQDVLSSFNLPIQENYTVNGEQQVMVCRKNIFNAIPQSLPNVEYQLVTDPDKVDWELDKDIIFRPSNNVDCCKEVLQFFQYCCKHRECLTRRFIWIVTMFGQYIHGDVVVNHNQASVWGLTKVFQTETTLNVVCVDVDDDSLHPLIEEIQRHSPEDNKIVFRNGIRYLPQFVPSAHTYYQNKQVTSKMPDNVQERLAIINDSKTFLVTGGMGGIGLVTAEWLISNGAKHLVLISRSGKLRAGVSAKEREIYERITNDPTVTLIEKACDVADKIMLTELVDSIKDLVPPISGIFHSAGLIDDNLVENMRWEQFNNVFGPKVYGTLNLHECFENLDCFVMYSSTAGMLGSNGQSNHSAANCFIDQFVHYRHSLGLVASSIQWGGWAEIGYAQDNNAITMIKQRGMGAINIEMGKSAMYSLFMRENVAGVLPIDTRKFLSVNRGNKMFAALEKQYNKKHRKNVEETADTYKTSFDQMVVKLRAVKTDQERLTIVNNALEEMCVQLGVVDIESERPWREMGLDSLSMVEFRNMLSLRFPGIPFSDTALFDYPTIALMSSNIIKNIGLLVEVRNTTTIKVKPFEPIAIIAVACDFPCGCDTADKTWKFIERGGDAMQTIPEDRFDVGEYPEIYTDKGAFLDTMFHFDYEAFHISRQEAILMDPQQRKCLERTDNLLQQVKNMDHKQTGVFVANMTYEHHGKTSDGTFSPYSGSGASPAVLANRISYTFNMTGPSMTIDTACSGSLVALDAACKALHAGDCKQAVVLGVNYLDHAGYQGECAAKMLSPNGRCATFSDQADGFARGEGCAGFIIKKVKDVVKDGDRCLAIICSTNVNQDGKSANLTSPNGPSQEACIQIALQKAGLSIDDIDFVEAHGTGTSLGDPLEVQALQNVFQERKRPLPIGAVKSNFGHLEGAAGMIGLIKSIKCFQYEKVPRNIHCETINPRILPYLESGVIAIPNREAYLLDDKKKTYYAGISSFGFGGTNAHVILQYKKE